MNKPQSISSNGSATNKEQGPQGVDKAPGEETSDNPGQFTADTQKGKKVDGDPEQESDKPVRQP